MEISPNLQRALRVAEAMQREAGNGPNMLGIEMVAGAPHILRSVADEELLTLKTLLRALEVGKMLLRARSSHLAASQPSEPKEGSQTTADGFPAERWTC